MGGWGLTPASARTHTKEPGARGARRCTTRSLPGRTQVNIVHAHLQTEGEARTAADARVAPAACLTSSCPRPTPFAHLSKLLNCVDRLGCRVAAAAAAAAALAKDALEHGGVSARRGDGWGRAVGVRAREKRGAPSLSRGRGCKGQGGVSGTNERGAGSGGRQFAPTAHTQAMPGAPMSTVITRAEVRGKGVGRERGERAGRQRRGDSARVSWPLGCPRHTTSEKLTWIPRAGRQPGVCRARGGAHAVC